MLRLRCRRFVDERRVRCTDDVFDTRRLPTLIEARFLEDFLKIFRFSVGNFMISLLLWVSTAEFWNFWFYHVPLCKLHWNYAPLMQNTFIISFGWYGWHRQSLRNIPQKRYGHVITICLLHQLIIIFVFFKL